MTNKTRFVWLCLAGAAIGVLWYTNRKKAEASESAARAQAEAAAEAAAQAAKNSIIARVSTYVETVPIWGVILGTVVDMREFSTPSQIAGRNFRDTSTNETAPISTPTVWVVKVEGNGISVQGTVYLLFNGDGTSFGGMFSASSAEDLGFPVF